jgi:Zn-dependent protease with chaperone function
MINWVLKVTYMLMVLSRMSIAYFVVSRKKIKTTSSFLVPILSNFDILFVINVISHVFVEAGKRQLVGWVKILNASPSKTGAVYAIQKEIDTRAFQNKIRNICNVFHDMIYIGLGFTVRPFMIFTPSQAIG